MKEPDFDVTKLMFFDYLKRVISNEDELVYRYLKNYITKMVRVGKTKQGIVLMGSKGTGKSTFATQMGLLVGMDYYFLEQDITNLKKEFNSHMERNIVLHIEEVPNEAGEYHKVQEILKTITTEEKQRIRRMRTDPYMGNQVANPIIITNNMNRHYFYNLDYEDDLNSIRPTTETEKDLLDLNSSKEDKFIKEEMVLTDGETDDSRELDIL